MTYSNEESAVHHHPVDGQPQEASVDLVAISANAPAKVPSLLKKIALEGETFAVGQDDRVRTELLEAARSLVYALETPREAMIRYCWSQVQLLLYTP